MFRLLRRLTVTSVALLALSIPFAGAASATSAEAADDTITWMVRPSDGVGEDGRSWIEQELDPGESVEEHLLIRNLSPIAVTFQLSAADGYFTDTGRFNMLTSDQESTDAGTWIDIQDTVDVPSGGDVVIPFTVTVPDNATPGDHPAGVAAAIRSGEDEQIGVESRVGFRVMTRVTGDLAPAVDATVSGGYGGSWNPFEPGRIGVDYTIANTGNTRLNVTPQVTVTALFGLVSYTIAGEEIVEIAPGETRTEAVTFPNVWPLFVYSAEVTGNANAVITGDEAAPAPIAVDASGTIIAMPWPQLITLIIAALLLWWLWRDRNRRERKLAALLDEARQEGREQNTVPDTEPADAPLRRTRATMGVAAVLLAIGLTATASPVWAAPDEDSRSVTLRVEVTPAATPVPTTTTTPSPTPTGGSGAGALPATGGTDLAPLGWAGAALAVLGAGILLARRNRPRTDPR